MRQITPFLSLELLTAVRSCSYHFPIKHTARLATATSGLHLMQNPAGAYSLRGQKVNGRSFGPSKRIEASTCLEDFCSFRKTRSLKSPGCWKNIDVKRTGKPRKIKRSQGTFGILSITCKNRNCGHKIRTYVPKLNWRTINSTVRFSFAVHLLFWKKWIFLALLVCCLISFNWNDDVSYPCAMLFKSLDWICWHRPTTAVTRAVGVISHLESCLKVMKEYKNLTANKKIKKCYPLQNCASSFQSIRNFETFLVEFCTLAIHARENRVCY